MAEGFAPEDYWEDPVEVWPDCRASLELFVSLQTQWHIVGGFGGGIRSGLRYEAVYPLLDRFAGDDREKWTRLFNDLQHMELAVLASASE
ncbi:DUF1799 domain-containing protein [Comamonas thiooxydans]|uniref:DUF1799 domain-containing protein n=1 Tax=Comamonas thiooxydans TaxID=363952 RepID=UPI000B40FD58|nr:DUF1799 domain-containing protein [Comamonas thiooxydans]